MPKNFDRMSASALPWHSPVATAAVQEAAATIAAFNLKHSAMFRGDAKSEAEAGEELEGHAVRVLRDFAKLSDDEDETSTQDGDEKAAEDASDGDKSPQEAPARLAKPPKLALAPQQSAACAEEKAAEEVKGPMECAPDSADNSVVEGEKSTQDGGAKPVAEAPSEASKSPTSSKDPPKRGRAQSDPELRASKAAMAEMRAQTEKLQAKTTTWLRVVHCGYGNQYWVQALRGSSLTFVLGRTHPEGCYVHLAPGVRVEHVVEQLMGLNLLARRQTAGEVQKRTNKSRLQFKTKVTIQADMDQPVSAEPLGGGERPEKDAKPTPALPARAWEALTYVSPLLHFAANPDLFRAGLRREFDAAHAQLLQEEPLRMHLHAP